MAKSRLSEEEAKRFFYVVSQVIADAHTNDSVEKEYITSRFIRQFKMVYPEYFDVEQFTKDVGLETPSTLIPANMEVK